MDSTNLEDFELLQKIGEGSFGQVFKIKEKSSGKVYAAKISFNALEDEPHDIIRNLSREINIISRLNHPSVLKFIGFSPINFKNKPKPVIITELSPNGSLRDIINLEKKGLSNINWTETHKLMNIYGIASAMHYLHMHNIIHRDLKPENILMDELLLPKVADFGLSKIKHKNEASMTSQSTLNFKGTPIYTAPEIWTNYEYSESSDVYAFAYIVYEIITIQEPFKDNDYFQLMMNVLNKVRPEIPSYVPESYQKLISSCWDQDPKERPTFAKILYDLENDKGFITDLVESEDYIDYIDYLNSIDFSFGPGKTISFEEYIKRDFKTLKTESIDHDLINAKLDDIKIEVKINIKKLPFEKPEDDPTVETARNYLYTILDDSDEEKIPEIVYTYAVLMEQGGMFDKNHKEALTFCKIAADLGFTEANTFLATLLSHSPDNAELIDRYMTIAINQGSLNAICQYAEMLEEGKSVPKNLEKAFNLYKMAAEKGEKYAYNKVGLMYQEGRGTEINYDEAMKYFQSAIDKGDIDAYSNIGLLYEKGQGVPKSTEKAMEYFKIAMEKGCDTAIGNYALLCEKTQNYKDAIKYFKQAAKTGKPQCYINIGGYYMNGYGVPIDTNKAIKYFKKAASKGCSVGSFNLGLMYETGKGVPVNYKLALQFYQQGEALGDINCIHNIAVMYNEGKGVEANKEEAFRYFKMAADLGSVSDCANTGSRYHYGVGTKVDLIQAEHYYKIAIEKGSNEAMFLYSLILSKGAEGIPQNVKEATRLLKQAADNGLPAAIQQYNELVHNSEKKTGINFEETLKSYKRSVDNGNISAVNDIIDLYLNEKVPPNDKDLFKYAKIGADNGNAKAMLVVSSLYKFGKGTPVNYEECLKYVKMSADLGNAEAMMSYGLILDTGEITTPNYDEALRYLKSAYESDCKVSIEFIFLMMMKGHIKQENIEEVINNIQESAIINVEKHALAVYATLLAQKIIRVENQDEETAKYFKMAADKGHVKSMCSYAIFLRDGVGVEKNYKEAINYFKKFNESNDPQAMEFIGDMLIKKQIDESDAAEVFTYFAESAKNGNSYALWKLGEMNLKGEIVPLNIDLGVKLIKNSADSGNLGAIKKYSTMLIKGEFVPKNEEEGKKYLQKYEGDDKQQLLQSLGLERNNEVTQISIDSLPNIEQQINNFLEGKKVDTNILFNILITMANKGFMPAIKGLALIYDKMNNFDESTKYHQIAADRGDPNSMYIIGKRLCTGNGILINYKSSCDYFKRSADAGNKFAANAYGIMLDHGLGTKKDKNQAYFYYKLAADQGLPSAFNNIGVLAFRGEYINKDYDLANRMFKTAADANCSIAMYNYAFMVQNGFSHQINNGLAAHYYKLAADMGDVNAMKAYANLLDKSGEALIQDSITHQPLLNDQNEVMKYRQMASYQNKIQDTIKYQSTYFANYVVNVDHNFFNDLGVDEAQKCVCSIY